MIPMAESNSRFCVNWLYVSVCLMLAGVGAAFVSYSITDQLIEERTQGLSTTSGFNWPIVVLVDLVCLMLFLAVCWTLYRDVKTEFGEYELRQLGILGDQKVIRWSEVIDVRVFNGVGFHVYDRAKKIVIAPYAYSVPRDVIMFIYNKTEQVQRGG